MIKPIIVIASVLSCFHAYAGSFEVRLTVASANCLVDNEASYSSLANSWSDDQPRMVIPTQCPPSEQQILEAEVTNNVSTDSPNLSENPNHPSPILAIRKSEMICFINKVNKALDGAPRSPRAIVRLNSPFCKQ